MTRSRLGSLALALILPLAACDDSTGAEGPGTLSILLTDAPGDFLQAIVEIERVELVGGDAGEEGEGGEGGPVVLMDTPFVTDLLTLSNDVASLVDEVLVPAGNYAQIRFVIPGACIEVEGENGTRTVYASAGFDDCGDADGSLQLPSFDASGLKVNLPAGASSIQQANYVILVDFDVAQSFGQQAGTSGMWVMNPVIRAEEFLLSTNLLVELTDGSQGGLEAVGGTLADFRARIDATPSPVDFVDPDGDGLWTAAFPFLLPGTVEVSVEKKDGVAYDFTTDPESPVSVELGSGAGGIATFTLSSATASN